MFIKALLLNMSIYIHTYSVRYFVQIIIKHEHVLINNNKKKPYGTLYNTHKKILSRCLNCRPI